MIRSLHRSNKCTLLIVTFALIASLFCLSSVTWAGTPNIVNPKQTYTYEVMVRDIKALVKAYPDLMAYRSIGKSEYGRDLWEMEVGHGPVKVFLNGSHHAREWITTITLMEMAENMGRSDRSGAMWNDIRISDLLDHVTFHIVPMVNPDGVTLQQRGPGAFPEKDRAALVRMNKGSKDFRRWKANGKGVDLNRQYPANWNGIANPAPGPCYMNYKGKAPLEAKEARAMAAYTRKLEPEMAVSYHSSGEYVYWNFKTPASHIERDRGIAAAYSAMTGYEMAKVNPNPSGGGFTDWFIGEFGKPALTPELGRLAGETHVPLSGWDRVWNQQKNVPWLLGETVLSLWMDGQRATEAAGEVELTEQTAFYPSPRLESGRAGTLKKGTYTAARVKGSWLELQSGEDTLWVAGTLARPVPPAPEKKPDPAQTPDPAAESVQASVHS